MTMATGGELLVRGLEAAGVQVVFGLPGVHNLPAWKAFAASSIRLVGVRHEQAAVYAADGYARATGRLGVAITTTGPGAANTLGAVGEAWASGSPVLIIATDIPRSLRREGVYRGVLHECTDQAGMFAPVVKATMRVLEPVEVRAAVQIAAFQALDAPARPVYLEVPTDTLAADVPGTHLQADVTDDRLRVPSPDELDAAAAVIEAAERPLLWVGGGAVRAQAGPEVAMLAERLAAPVITTYQARGLLGADHPCATDLPPHVPEVGELWDEADVVVAVGTDFDGMMTQNWLQPAPPRLVTVNVDPVDAAKSYPVEVNLVGDATRTVGALLQRVPERAGLEALHERLLERRAAVRERLRAEHPAELAFLDAFAAAVGDAVVVADMCIPGYWLGAFHPVPRPRALAYPVGWGTLGFGFPAALGPALAGIGPVVSVSGDGGFLFACGELATVAQERIPLTAVIVDDGGYGMLRYDQVHAGDPTFGVDLHAPDFVALARSFGVEAEAVDGLGADFGAALARHVAMDAPSVLVASARLDPPPTTSPRWYRKEQR
jgi:thiamine pyrophosphate-dependent acetolactate synthase large subunit-like protein